MTLGSTRSPERALAPGESSAVCLSASAAGCLSAAGCTGARLVADTMQSTASSMQRRLGVTMTTTTAGLTGERDSSVRTLSLAEPGQQL